MPVHYVIYKYNPKTRARETLHEMVPEAMVDWLREQSEGELSRKERSQGVVILKEPEAKRLWQRASQEEAPAALLRQRVKSTRSGSRSRRPVPKKP